MNKLKIDTCPICGGKEMRRVLTCIDHQASGEMFPLCRCAACGFLMTQDPPVEEEIGAYYATPDYISHSDTHRGLVNKLYHHVRSLMLRRKARLVVRVAQKPAGRLMDLGAGTGYFADYMQRQGWAVEAVEKDAGARAFAHERFGLDEQPLSVLDTYPEGSMDAITLWHVMEHIQRLEETWDLLHHLLTPSGVLVVAVPNWKSYDARRYGAYWAAYDVPRHLWHFTPATIQQIASHHGFIMAERRPLPLDAFYVSMLSERYMSHSFPMLRGFLTGLLAWANSLASKDRSSSMIYVFRKKTA